MKVGLDLDGTLVTCMERQVRLLSVLAKACKIDLDSLKVWNLKREGFTNKSALIEQGVSEFNSSVIARLWEQEIEDFHWLLYDRLQCQVLQFLADLKIAGHSLHLISARRNPITAKMQIELLGLNVFSTVDFVDPFDRFAKQRVFSRIAPDVYIGDTEWDYFCAEEANVPVILVCTGLRSRSYLELMCKVQVKESFADAVRSFL